ncbi:MAG: hypothetical protein NUV34_04765, partial [Sulfuricaulis sp.]|nr:hypothetical protein [Sulfuricaulis sp.]
VWVSLVVPLPPAGVVQQWRDVEAMLRLNPYYYFKSWKRTGPTTYRVEFENQSNQTQNTLVIEAREGPGPEFTLHYESGLKRRTVFSVEAVMGGSRLTITDDYEGVPEAERQQRLPEVDKSLKAWGESLRVYFVRLKRWSWLPGWRWYIRRLWIPMKPSARRIVWWIYLITVAEFFFFLFVVLIFTIERGS